MQELLHYSVIQSSLKEECCILAPLKPTAWGALKIIASPATVRGAFLKIIASPATVRRKKRVNLANIFFIGGRNA